MMHGAWLKGLWMGYCCRLRATVAKLFIQSCVVWHPTSYTDATNGSTLLHRPTACLSLRWSTTRLLQWLFAIALTATMDTHAVSGGKHAAASR